MQPQKLATFALVTTLQLLVAFSQEANSNANITVTSGKRFVTLGSTISFTCNVHNPAITAVSWNIDNGGTMQQRVLPGGRFQLSNPYGRVLTIQNVLASDAGDYYCVWRKSATTSEFSNPSALCIYETPVITIASSFIGNVETDFWISMQVTGNPTPNITVLRNSQLLSSARHQVNASGLLISSLRSQDTGGYQICASNAPNIQTCESFSVIVKGLPVICVHPATRNGEVPTCADSVSVKKGNNVTLICNATGSYTGDLTMRWLAVQPGTTTQLSSTEVELYIDNVQSSQSYSCEANNLIGRTVVSTEVIGTSIPTEPTNLRLVADGRIAVSWRPPTNENGSPVTAYYVELRCGSDVSVTMVPPNDYNINFYECKKCKVNVRAENLCGNSSSTSSTISCNSTAESSSGSSSTLVIVVGTVVVIVFLSLTVLVIVVFVCWWKRQKQMDLVGDPENARHAVKVDSLKLSVSSLPPPFIKRVSSIRQHRSLLDIPKDSVVLRDVLCDGTFVELCKGLVSLPETGSKTHEVMIKKVKESAPREEEHNLQEEIKMMSTIGIHENVVGLLRTCSESPVFLITEYFAHGDLRGFLRSSRGHYGMYTVSPGASYKTHPCTVHTQDLLKIATQVAAGMSFLAERRISHRSLCACNVLVGTGLQVKVYNYGQKSNSEATPHNYAKWMAPEMLFDGTANTMSDVWSFGVTFWEIVTIGGSPYPQTHSEQMRELLQTGHRMPRPEHCTDEIYDIMGQCWQHNPSLRSTFSAMHKQLDAMCKSKLSYLDPSLYNDSEYSQFEDTGQLMTAL